MKNEVIVFSLGGSLIVPDSVDYRYLHKFKLFIDKLLRNYKVIVVTGGGKTARKYIESLKKERTGEVFYSLVGIMATKLNARLISGLFSIKGQIPDRLIDVKKQLDKKRIVICGALGFQPDMTSDGDAAEIAEYLKAKIFINLTNVDGLFDKNPLTYKNAKLIKFITYDNFLDIINGIKYEAGQHFVLDQAAAVIISKSKMPTLIINGRKLENVSNYLQGKRFLGTIIS